MGAKLTLIFTVISSIAMLPNFSLVRIGYAFLISGMYSFGIGTGCGLISDFLNWKWDWITQTRKRLLTGIVSTIIYTTTIVLLVNYYRMVIVQGHAADKFFTFPLIWEHLFYIILSLGIAAFYHAKAFMQELKHSINQQNQLEKENIASQYEALKNQTDPHFFFNSLNVLSSLVDENPETAQHFIGNLSNIYRYILEQKNKELVSIEDELGFADKYIFLQKIRFEEGIHFDTDISYDQLKQNTIPLALQILLENIFKHNSISEEKPIYIKIFTEDNYLVISNNVNKKAIFQDSSRIGLDNIKARYKHFSENPVVIVNDDKQFTVKLPLISN